MTLCRRRPVIRSWALLVILSVAAANFLWQLGSPSYFIDEAYSVMHSLPGFGTLFHVVAHTETTPYTYFLFLHEWMLRTGSQSEWVTRLPSALAGIALVAAVYWMAGAFVQRRAALWSAALCALCPLISGYAQEARVYVFAMLAMVIAVGATLRATQRPERRAALLTLGALSCFLAVWLHYTALGVVLPLAGFVATRSQLTWQARTAFVGACVLAQATLMPLLLQQYSEYPNGGAISGQIDWTNAVSVIGTPFGPRVGAPLNVWSVAGAVIVLLAALALLFSPDRERVAHRKLLLALGAVGVIGLFVLDLAGKHILITRYTAVTAPFLVTVVAAACAVVPRAPAVAFASAALAVCIAGLVMNHSSSGLYAPARQVIDYIAPRQRPGDFLITPGPAVDNIPLFYYDIRRLRPKLLFYSINDPRDASLLWHHRGVWIVDAPAAPTRRAALAPIRRALHAFRYRVIGVRLYTTSVTLALIRAVR